MFLVHLLSVEALEKNRAPFPHYIMCQANVQKHQAFATDEAVLPFIFLTPCPSVAPIAGEKPTAAAASRTRTWQQP
jgi:hypothetical protein